MKSIFSALTMASIMITANTTFADSTGDFTISENSFKDIFNNARMGQPDSTPWPATYWPYDTNGTAAKVQNKVFSNGNSGSSPMQAFDKIAGLSGTQSANTWEKDNHTCDHVQGQEEKEGCKEWWGHCNGWSGAAIKEDEPRNEFTVDNVKLSSSDVKGILSEAWLTCNSNFAGETNKSSTTDEGIRTGWIDNTKSEEYRQFWDVTPRAFFLIMTNYVGLKKMGVAIDRFTGDEVWNQPVVGYRILPLDPSGISKQTLNGKNVWAVRVKMKLYWANDDGVSPGALSTGFDIKRDTSDAPAVEQNLPKTNTNEQAYDGRLLEFTLWFDNEVKISTDGLQVLSDARLVGDGIWKMQENPRSYSADQLNNGHPDFIWLPTNVVVDTQGSYGNPYLSAKTIKKISAANKKANGSSAGGSDDGSNDSNSDSGSGKLSSFKIQFASNAFDNLKEVSEVSVRRKLNRLFRRAGWKSSIGADDISIRGSLVKLTVTFPDGVEKSALETLFSDSGLSTTSIDKAQ